MTNNVYVCYNTINILHKLFGDIKLNYKQFSAMINMHEKTENDRVIYTAYYICCKEESTQFTLDDVFNKLDSHNYGVSNTSRIRAYLKKSKDFRLIKKSVYVFSPKRKAEMDIECDFIQENQDIVTDGELLDETLFCGHRGYLTKLVKQANHCYENNCYDACAVMIRRSFEILLILSYQSLGIENEIKNGDGNYKMIKDICANAKMNTVLNLSRSKNDLDSIRELGNYAAHKFYYNTQPKDINDLKVKIRVCFEELLYKSGLKS